MQSFEPVTRRRPPNRITFQWPEIFPGVKGYAYCHHGEIWIPMVWGDGTGQVGRMLDALSDRCRIVDVVNSKLRGMLVRRGWVWARKYRHEVWAPTERKNMATVILKCFKITLEDGEQIDVYSEHNLSSLDSTLRYTKSIERVYGRAGLGTKGPVIHDGRPILKEIIPTDRITSACSLEDTDRILEAHKAARRMLEKSVDSPLEA